MQSAMHAIFTNSFSFKKRNINIESQVHEIIFYFVPKMYPKTEE